MGKGSKGSSGASKSSGGSTGKSSSSSSGGGRSKGGSVSVVSGHRYHSYSNSSTKGGSRYVYIGKEGGTPQFIDYGGKGK